MDRETGLPTGGGVDCVRTSETGLPTGGGVNCVRTSVLRSPHREL